MIDRIRMLFRSSSKAKLVVLFVLFSIVLVECAVNSYYKARIEKRLHHTVESHTGFYNATVESYKTTSEVIAKQILANPKLTKILIDSIDKSKIKSSHDELLSSFKTVYKDNQSISLNILQFQNANGDVVARFQKPTEYGDNVIPFRYLLRECQEKHKSVFGFERGRFFNAYRYVYPVFANNKFVGSVELGIAESQINNSIRKNFGVGVYLALSNTITDKKSVQFQQKSFFTSENLYHNGSIYSQAELDLIGRLLKDFEFTQGNVTKDGYYYHYGLNSDTAYTVVVKPFLDFYGKKIGYIVFYEKNNDLKSLQKELYFALIITMIMLVFAYISLIGLYHWYNKEKLQQQVAISKENKSLVEAMIEAEPECVKIIDEYGNLIYMNQAGLDMIDASADEIFGKSVLNIVNPEYRDEFSDMCKQVLAGNKKNIIFETTSLKGKRLWLDTTSVPAKFDGKNATRYY